MKAVDMTKIYANKSYKGRWIALKSFTSNPTVIASSKNLKDVMRLAEEKGYKHPVMMQIPKKILPIVGIF